MAGSGLVGIKRRIKSVTNTRKITKAMGLVATSKFKRTREALEVNTPYHDFLKTIMSNVLENEDISSIYKDGNSSRKKLYVVFTSDSGLCGAFNINVLNRAMEEISKDKENSIIMVIGEKGVSFFNRFNYDISQKYVNIPDNPTLGDANDFAAEALQMYANAEVGEINAVYNHFYSQTKNEVQVEKVLPLSSNLEVKNTKGRYMKFEPEAQNLLDDIIPLYMREKMLYFLINSKNGEQAIRMTAMDGATKNANQLLDKLKLQYNRLRQSAITQEISEIVGGAEAQK